MTDRLTPEEIAARWRSPVPRALRTRLRGILRYLDAHWPAPRPVRLEFRAPAERHEAIATADLVGSRFVIRIDPRACYYHALDLLLHEYAHCAAWRVPGDAHSAAWAGTLVELLRAFEEGDALGESESW